MTQAEMILSELRHRTVCGTWLLQMHIPRYAARINELRQAGHQIETVPCPHHYHTHTSRIAAYQLTR